MPILTPQYDPNIDRYPGNEQAIQVAGLVANTLQGNRAAGQRDRALDMQEVGQAAQIEQSQRRLSLMEEDAQRRAELFKQAQDEQKGIAAANKFKLDMMRQAQRGKESDPELEARFSALDDAAKDLPDAAKSALFADAAPAIENFVVQRSTRRLFDTIGDSLSAGAYSENAEIQQQFQPRWDEIGKQAEAITQDQNMPPAMMARALDMLGDQANDLRKQQAKSDAEATQFKSALGFLRGKRGAVTPGSPGETRLIEIEQLLAQRAIEPKEALRWGQAVEIGDTERWVREDGSVEFISAEERFKREMAVERLNFEREREAFRQQLETRKQDSREKNPIGMQARGLSGSTNESVAEKILGVEPSGPEKGKIYAPVLNADGTPKMTSPWFGEGKAVYEWRVPTPQEWEAAILQAGEVNRRGIGVEGIPQNQQAQNPQPQMRPQEGQKTGPRRIEDAPRGLSDADVIRWMRGEI